LAKHGIRAKALSGTGGGDPAAHSWWDGGSFHHKLARSTGLTPQPRRYVELDALSHPVQMIHRRKKPHYDHLYAHRLGL
jgi:hypothetical protein